MRKDLTDKEKEEYFELLRKKRFVLSNLIKYYSFIVSYASEDEIREKVRFLETIAALTNKIFDTSLYEE